MCEATNGGLEPPQALGSATKDAVALADRCGGAACVGLVIIVHTTIVTNA